MAAARVGAWIAAVALCGAASAQVQVKDVGAFEFQLPAADGLSGIAYAGDDLYWVASDAGTYLHRLEIQVDRESGAVVSVKPRGGLQLADAAGAPLGPREAKDREDIVIGPRGDEVFLVNEQCGVSISPCIDRHVLADGRLVSRTTPEDDPQLAVFAGFEFNRGFESIAAIPDGGFWLAIERALPADGGPSTTSAGSPVRLQRLDAELRGVDQYVYLTDPIAKAILWPPYLTPRSGSRVVGFLIAPGGELVVLENVFQGSAWGAPQSRIRLYEVDLSGATDVSQGEVARGFRGREFQPVAKRRLIELAFEGVSSNFEGMTLGPQLDNGDHAVLLIRDNARGTDQTVYALRLRSAAESP